MKRWKPNDLRYIAFLDIMGFKDLVARRDHGYVEKVLTETSDIARYFTGEEVHEDGIVGIKSITFSDTILFVTSDDSPEVLRSLLGILCQFQASALQKTIPIKGALSYGRITVNQSQSIYHGQPLIDAYELQDQVHYYGIVLDNVIEARIFDLIEEGHLSLGILKNWIHKLPTPLKAGLINHFNIRVHSLEDTTVQSLYNGCSGSTRKYVDNTVSIHNEMDNTISQK